MSILFQQTLEKVTWVRISPAGMDDRHYDFYYGQGGV